MILHNIKQSVRGMMKNKVFTFLNITGFAVGFAAFMILALYTYQEYSVDRQVPNHERIFRLVNAEKNRAIIDYDAVATLKETYPDIELAVPVEYADWGNMDPYLQIEGQESFVKLKDFISTNNDFFKLFPIQVIAGNPKQLFTDLQSVILTRSTAEKLFGTTDIIGSNVNFNNYFPVVVSAVIEDLPSNMSINGQMFFNSDNENFRFSNNCDDGNCYNPTTAYLLLDDKINISSFETKLNQSFPQNKMNITKVSLQPLADIYLNSTIEQTNNKIGNKSIIQIFLAIALLTLLLSIINYVNFSITRQLSTLKDFGIRITNGAGMAQLIRYYAVDVALLIIFSVFIAYLLTLIGLPVASKLLNATLDSQQFTQPALLGIILFAIVLVWFVATLIPLSILSRFDIQMLFGKKTMRMGKNRWQNVLTITQFVISIVLLTSLLLIQKQLNFAKSYNLGFNDERLMYIDLPFDFKNKEALYNQIKSLPFVEQTSFSHGMSGGPSLYMGNGNDDDDKFFYMKSIYMDDHFFKTFQLELLEGRSLLASDLNNVCYMNETAMKKYGWDNYEGKRFNNGRKGGFEVIGVVKDFNVASLRDQIDPVCLMFSDAQQTALNIKLASGDLGKQMQSIETIWHDLAGVTPFDFAFYDDYFDALYRKEESQAKTIGIFSLLAFIITCIGLLGQVFQTTQNRIKEIGIRKINGATIKEILSLLNKSYVKWVVIAFIIATPIAYYAMNKWLENFAYKTTLSWWIFALAGLSALVIALLTVSWQSYRAASRNPVEALRYE